MNREMIANELLLAIQDVMDAENERLVTAEEMEPYCGACARQIAAGEIEVTVGELHEAIHAQKRG